jgi:hypothetical protein
MMELGVTWVGLTGDLRISAPANFRQVQAIVMFGYVMRDT